jgi:hypothetical protein
MDQFVIKSCNRSREPVSVTMPVEEDASEADRYEYHDQFSPDDYDMMEEGQNHPEERDTCNISVMDKKAILDMEKRSAKVSISSCPSTPTTEGSMTMSSSPHSLDDLQSFTQESLQGTATVTTIREGEEQVFGTGDEERSELTTEDYVEAALRQEKELSRATRLVENGAGAEQLQTRIRVFPGAVSMIPDISDGEDGLDGGVRQGIRQPTRFGSIQSGDMYTGHGNLAVASPVMEEELGETQDGNVPQAEAIVRESKMENWTCSFVLGCLLLSIVLVTGILMGVFLLPSLKVEEEGMNDLAEGSDGRPGVTFAPTTYRESLGIEEQIAVLLGASKLTNATSPHYKALQWILHDDPLQLPKTATNLVQRFILVLFYFQTTQNGPWRTCNPALLDNETHVCDFLTLRWVFPELAFDTIPANRWLSLAHECTWAGVDCEADVVIDLKLGKYTVQDQGSPHVALIAIKNPPLHSANIDANNLSGNLPFELGYLPELMGLSFVHNELTGILSSALALEMHRITQIQLQHNQLSGSIPPEWCQLKNVERFNLAENYLTGPLPTEIGQLGSNHNGNSLMGLFLFSNPGLTGPIPKEIGNLKSLCKRVVDQGPQACSYVCDMPLTLYLAPILAFLRISKTGLEGTILSHDVANLSSQDVVFTPFTYLSYSPQDRSLQR